LTAAVLLVAIGAFGWMLWKGYQEGHTTHSPPPAARGHSLGWQCAVIDGLYPAETDTVVTRYNYLLQSIATPTGETPHHVADCAVIARRLLRQEFGVEHLGSDFPADDTGTRLGDLFAYVPEADGQ
jgi:hypothetical protein